MLLYALCKCEQLLSFMDMRAVLCGATYRSTVKLSKCYIVQFVINCCLQYQKLLDSVKAFQRYNQKMCVCLIFWPTLYVKTVWGPVC